MGKDSKDNMPLKPRPSAKPKEHAMPKARPHKLYKPAAPKHSGQVTVKGHKRGYPQ